MPVGARRLASRSRGVPTLQRVETIRYTLPFSYSNVERPAHGGGTAVRKVEHGERLAQGRGCVLRVRRAGPEAAPRVGPESQRHDRAAASPIELHVATGHVDRAVAARIHRERVGASQVHRRAGGSVDEEQPRWRVHLGVDLAVLERQAVIATLRAHQANARIGLHLHVPDVAHQNQGARRVVGLEPLADLERPGRAEGRAPDHGQSGEAHDLPGATLDPVPPAEQRHGEDRRGGERQEQPGSPPILVSRFPFPGQRPGNSSFDLRPEIPPRLDALGEPGGLLEQLAELRWVVALPHDSSISRNRRRARNSWAFEVPTAIPVSSAISACPYPSTSYSTNTSRAPGGSAATARSRSRASPGLESRPRPGCSSAPGSSVANTRRVRRRVVRRLMNTTFTVRRYSHDPNALSPRKLPSRSHARTKASCVSSSASRASAVSRRHSAYTRPACSR